MSKHLWAPWRLDYIQGLDMDHPEPASPGGCFLCEAGQLQPDSTEAADILLIDRTDESLVMLNRYPYTNGHMLIAPLVHVGELVDLDSAVRGAMMDMAVRAGETLKRAMHCQGLNIGINIGRCGGAGLPGHVHMHVVPRWHGDVNFMETVGQVRVIPQALDHAYATIKEHWE